jgi:MFS family permease
MPEGSTTATMGVGNVGGALKPPLRDGARSPAPAPAPIVSRDWRAATWALLFVVSGAQLLDGLDVSMAGVAIPSIGTQLHLPASSLQWIVSGYVLGFGGFLLLGGRTSDLLGRRRVFLTALAIFGVASVVGGLVSDEFALVALRFVKGVSAGFTVPAGLSIVTTSFAEGPARARALGIYTAFGASGFTLGLVAGGVLTGLSWRATLIAPGPVALLLVAAGLRVIPSSTRERVSLRSFDVGGAVTSTAGLLLLVNGIVEAPSQGWTSLSTIGALAAAVVLLALFIVLERRHPRPLLRLRLLRSASLLHANLVGALLLGSYVAFQFILTLYVQNSLGWSPIQMALSFAPSGVMAFIVAPRVGAVVPRFGTERLLLVGLAVAFVGYLLLLRVSPSMPYVEFLLPTIITTGTAFAIVFPAVNIQATGGIASGEQGVASGIVNTSMQLGGALMLAAATAVLGTSTVTAQHGQLLPHMDAALSVPAVATGLALAVTVARLVVVRRTSHGTARTDHQTGEEVNG